MPGKIATKNKAVAQPTKNLCFTKKTKDAPKIISTIPESITTKSASSGTHGGTCAKNSALFQVKWLMPANKRKAPRNTLKYGLYLFISLYDEPVFKQGQVGFYKALNIDL